MNTIRQYMCVRVRILTMPTSIEACHYQYQTHIIPDSDQTSQTKQNNNKCIHILRVKGEEFIRRAD